MSWTRFVAEALLFVSLYESNFEMSQYINVTDFFSEEIGAGAGVADSVPAEDSCKGKLCYIVLIFILLHCNI